MKKIILLIMGLGLLTGCSFKKQTLENSTIYTTVYPVQYIMDYLYGSDSSISSIYPLDVDLNNYELTTKQIDEYAKGDLFVYIGLGKELEIAKTFINKNDKLLIIDATYGLNYNYDIKELWLAPNNFLMLAKNIKNSLNEYLDNTIKEDEVENKYNELYAKVSWIDAELRSIAKEARESDNNTLVVASNVFKFLDNYGFNVISLEDIEKNGSESEIADVKSKFKNAKYNALIKLKSMENTELMQDIITSSKAQVIEIDDIMTSTGVDYISMQNENVAVLRNLLLD